MTERLWKEFPGKYSSTPRDVMPVCVELVWTNGRLQEVERELGANNVSFWL